MKDKKNIIYWIFTIVLSIGMTISAINQLSGNEQQMEEMLRLGYPDYFSYFLGISKLAGVITILIPGYPLIKEWAYAGFGFILIAAIVSHIGVGTDIFINSIPAVIFGVIVYISWHLRPLGRKLN